MDEIVTGVDNSLVDSNESVLEMVVLDCLMFTFSPSSSLVTANESTLGLAIIKPLMYFVFLLECALMSKFRGNELQIIIESLPSLKLVAVVLETTVFPFTDGIDFDFC